MMNKMDEGKKEKLSTQASMSPKVCNCQCKCACGTGGNAVDSNNFDQDWAANSSITQP